ncbi:MAG: B12-binding domain-containing radical SAM protein [Spirochaetes bacterium]|nr:B12-binding domain-containing radical SAM protein [Spirochaetota bacterium]
MKVLLINPPYPFEESPSPPFGLMALAAYLEDKNIEVKIEDYIVNRFSEQRVKSIMSTFAPDVVGSTGVTMNIKKALSILQIYKQVNPDLVTVLGGPHATFDAHNILLHHPYIDVIVRGEGELTFHQLLSHLYDKSTYPDIAGISYRDNDNTIVHNPNRDFIPDINILPYPARHLVELSKYRALGFPINMMTSRGCPFNCIFCVGSKMVGRKVRYFDTDRVVNEFAMLATMKFKQINIVDDLFTSNKSRCIEVCKEIVRRGIQHPWTAFARVDTVNLELLEHMKEAGCTMLCFGIESGNQEILDKVKKKITLEKCKQAVEMCKKVGISPMTSYILGLPGETEETIKKTLEFAKELSDNYGFHVLAPFPGTEVREMKDYYEIEILTNDWDLYDANRAVSVTPWVTAEKINEIVDRFNGSIKAYILSLGEKLKQCQTLTDKEQELISNIRSFEIVRDMILDRLVEDYPGVENGVPVDAKKEFVEYLLQKTKFPKEEIINEVERLINLRCIDFIYRENKIYPIWT